jgi:chromosome segregation ATPase
VTSLHKLAQIREDLEEIRHHINVILTRDDLRVIDWELESMLKIVNIMLEGKIGKPNRKKLAAIRDKIEAIRDELDELRQEITNMSQELKTMLEGESP